MDRRLINDRRTIYIEERGQKMLEQNLRLINENIAKAAEKTNRNREDITLIGVTKTIEAERVNQAVSLGVRDLGENRVQELLNKYPLVGDGQSSVNWHLIGHLQRNKVKYIMDKVCLIHSVDSTRLAEEISRQATDLGITKDILVEVNVGEEESKMGIRLEEADRFVKEISSLDGIRVNGLMTVAPFVENPEENRSLFRKMSQLFVDINKNILNNRGMSFLSMGMTNDYMVAIEEGSNMVRIGTGLFGHR